MSPTSVISLLLARAARGNRTPHDDGARIALCVEGGAMRGVVSAGMASALEDLGLVHAFDAVYGSSAGAINAAYFLAGQAGFGTAIYSEDINHHQFISMWRPLAGRPIVDLGFLVDEVATRRKPLDTARVLASPVPLTVMATDVAVAGRAPLRDFGSGRELFDAMRAGATMPILAGPPMTFRGRAYLDASLTEPIPVPIAEAEGHTHIVVLLTRPSETPRKTTLFDRAYVLPRLRRVSGEIARLYTDRGAPYTELLGHIANGRGPAGRAQVLGLRPGPPAVSKLETDAERLRTAARQGYDAVMVAFSGQ